jgi:cobalt-zinc-cadmium efflux system protein
MLSGDELMAQHGHDASYPHAHEHRHPSTEVTGRTLAGAVGVTLMFVAIEALFGWFGHSLALLSDAGHNLTDAAALGFSWYAVRVAERPSHEGMTYGYHRMGILAALANATSLAVIAAVITWEAIARLRHPEAPNAGVMIGVAAAAMVLNAAIGWRLHGSAKSDLNVRSAYLHMMGDAVSAFGVVVAGIIVGITREPYADPIVSLLIAALILWSGYGVFRESTTVLLEGTPSGTDMPAVIEAIRSVGGVLDVHDLHVWMVGPGVVACSCHILVAEQSVREGQQVLRAVVRDLRSRFHINHTTIQIEVEGCESNDMYCIAERAMRH